MSATPVSIDSPPGALIRTDSERERDLQAQMQHLISLQYQEQEQHYYDSVTPSSAMATSHKSFSRGSRQQNLQSLGKQQQQQLHPSTSNCDSFVNAEVVRAPHASSRDSLDPKTIRQPDVGKGTIVFSGKLREYSNRNSSSSDSSPSKEYLQQQQEQLQKLQQHLSPHLQQSAVTSSSRGTTPSKYHSTPPKHPPQQIYTGYGSLPQEQQQQQPDLTQHHEFHYGNPDYHDPYDKSNQSPAKDLLYDENDIDGNGHRSQRTCCCERICCLYRPLINLLQQENLHRSFCYGAIDGLLTGSGVVSAFWGLGVLSVNTSWNVRLAVTCLAVSACVADSVCMALGHIWTTYVVTTSHTEERARERQQLETNKSQSKGRLVDMLLARGMLKIDAMSLADTLEGYPDLLISALVGDSLLAGGDERGEDEQTDDGYGHLQGCQFEVNDEAQQQNQHQLPNNPQAMGEGPFGSFGSWRFPSYGHFGVSPFDSDSHTNTMLQESQKEGLFMMMGFSIFAVVPSLLWLFLPLFFQNEDIEGSSGHSSSKSISTTSTGVSTASPMVALPSLIIFNLSAVVWCLGVWKSHFVDSNWVVFGMENIGVLLVCIFLAYCVAMLLALALGFEASQTDKFLPSMVSNHYL